MNIAVGLLPKKIKISKRSNSAEFIDFLWNLAHTFSLAMRTKNVKKIEFF